MNGNNLAMKAQSFGILREIDKLYHSQCNNLMKYDEIRIASYIILASIGLEHVGIEELAIFCDLNRLQFPFDSAFTNTMFNATCKHLLNEQCSYIKKDYLRQHYVVPVKKLHKFFKSYASHHL